MPSLCAAAPCPNARSNAASLVALAREIPRLVTVLTTASRTPWRGRHARAFSPPNKRISPGSRLMPAVNFAPRSTTTGKHVKNGPTVNWRIGQPPRRRLKKGAPSEPPRRNRPGNRNALRPSSRPRSGFRSPGDRGAAAGSAAGRARTGTTAECRHQRSCWPGAALLLRWIGPVSWPSRQDLRKRTGASASGAGLLSLCAMPKRILSARSGSAAGTVFAHTRSSADDGQHGGAGEL